MNHDLDAINAALASGDWAIPPVGSVIFLPWCLNGDGTCEVLSIRPKPARNGERWVFFDVQFSTDRSFYCLHNGYMKHGLTILSLPDDAPPFSKWKRCWGSSDW